MKKLIYTLGSIFTMFVMTAQVNVAFAQSYYSSRSGDDIAGGVLALYAVILCVICVVFIASYIFISWNIKTILDKLNYANPMYGWIPFLQNYALAKAIGLDDTSALIVTIVPMTVFIPFVNYCTSIFAYGVSGYLWMKAGTAMGKQELYGLLVLIPLVNLFVIYDIAQNGTPVKK